jgi:uncharacterized caspase-like protein
MLHAVLIGINQYEDPEVPNLSFARKDAEAFASLLSDRIKPEERRVQTLVDKAATRSNVLRVIGDELPRMVKPEDIVLLYFACHGSPEKQALPDETSMYLVLHDTDYRRIYSTGIDMERDIRALMGRLRNAKLVLLFLDACFSGRAGGRTFPGPVLTSCQSRSDYRGDDQISLKDLDLGRGRALIAAADEGQVAREDPELGHGIFTYHLLQALGNRRGDQAMIPIGDLYRDVEAAVRKATGGAQEPVFNGSFVRGALPILG